jgi:hypothetical protein
MKVVQTVLAEKLCFLENLPSNEITKLSTRQ